MGTGALGEGASDAGGLRTAAALSNSKARRGAHGKHKARLTQPLNIHVKIERFELDFG